MISAKKDVLVLRAQAQRNLGRVMAMIFWMATSYALWMTPVNSQDQQVTKMMSIICLGLGWMAWLMAVLKTQQMKKIMEKEGEIR